MTQRVSWVGVGGAVMVVVELSFTEIMISLLLQRPLSNPFILWLSEMEETALCHIGSQPLSYNTALPVSAQKRLKIKEFIHVDNDPV